jgi:GT2 family glycosyltransferase
MGLLGIAGHVHKYFTKESEGYFGRLKMVQNYLAVTGACLAVRKELYREVGGLEEKYLTVAYNDVDFCLKLVEKGYRNIWTPYAELFHHESKSRGKDDTPEKKKRYEMEKRYMRRRWKNFIEHDPYYSPHLTRISEDVIIGERRK